MSQTINSKHYSNVSDSELAQAMMGRDQLALAEAMSRTNNMTNTLVRRLIVDIDQVEEVLRKVYAQLWTNTPLEVNFQGWLRRITWKESVAYLRKTGQAPKFPSVARMLPDLPEPETKTYDPAERNLGILPEDWQRAVVAANDMGIPTAKQDDPNAAYVLINALLNLNEIKKKTADELQQYQVQPFVSPDLIARVPQLGDWAFKLGTYAQLAQVDAVLRDEPEIAKIATAIQGGARRFLGLPLSQDVGNRILVETIIQDFKGMRPGHTDASEAATPVATPASTPALDIAADDAADDAPSSDEAPDNVVSIDSASNAGALDAEVAQDEHTALGETSAEEMVLPGDSTDGGEDSSRQMVHTSTSVTEFGADPFDDAFDDVDDPSAAAMVRQMFADSGIEDDDDQLVGGLLSPATNAGQETQMWTIPQPQNDAQMRLSSVIVDEAFDGDDPFSLEDTAWVAPIPDDADSVFLGDNAPQMAPPPAMDAEPTVVQGGAPVPGAMPDGAAPGTPGTYPVPQPPVQAQPTEVPADMANIPYDPETSQRFAASVPDEYSERSLGDAPMGTLGDAGDSPVAKAMATARTLWFDQPTLVPMGVGAVLGIILYLILSLIF